MDDLVVYLPASPMGVFECKLDQSFVNVAPEQTDYFWCGFWGRRNLSGQVHGDERWIGE